MKVTRKTLVISLAVGIPLFLVGGYFLADRVAKPLYKRHRQEKFDSSARDFLAKGDFDNAMLFVRKNLANNQQSTPTWKLAVEIAERRNDPSIVFYLDRVAQLEPTLDNRLKLIRTAIRHQRYDVADKAISAVGPEAKNSADFHELAAQSSLRGGNPVQAKFHLMTLTALRPDDRKARLDLAQVRLGEAGTNADLRGAIRSELRTLVSDPALRERALATLLRDSMQNRDARESLETAAQLRLSPDMNPSNGLLIAEALRNFDAPALPSYLQQLKTSSANDPAQAARLGRYLVGAGRTAEAREWLQGLPEKVAAETEVQTSLAAALGDLRAWTDLEAYLKDKKWGSMDFLRLAFLAYSQRQLGNQRAFEETWRASLVGAGSNSAKLEALARQVGSWGWREQRVEVLWRIFQQNPSDEKTRQQLFTFERAQGNTANLNRLFSRLLEANPTDAGTKNNVAYTSLLLNANTPRALALAREAHESDRKSAFYATTYAFALWRDGKAAEARKLLDSVDSVQLWQAERVVIHASILAAVDELEQADLLLNSVNDRGLLPEEKRLLADARATVERTRQQRSRNVRIAESVASSREANPTGKSWLALLPAALRDKPTLAMELADSLYARDEFAQLQKEVSGDRWERNDFVRIALLAYAHRKQDRASDSRAAWRMTVNTTGTRADQQRVLAALAAAWGWDDERMELLGRILQRQPEDRALLDELVAFHFQRRNTGELARTYGSIVASGGGDAATRSRFAYYSLLMGNNASEAHVAAKTAFDAAPADSFAARAFAFSLWKQNQPAAGIGALGQVATRINPDVDLSLTFALLHEAAGNAAESRRHLDRFAVESALPEEQALAAELRKRLDR